MSQDIVSFLSGFAGSAVGAYFALSTLGLCRDIGKLASGCAELAREAIELRRQVEALKIRLHNLERLQ